MSISQQQLKNFQSHIGVMAAIATSSPKQVRQILQNPSDNLVRALSTAVRIALKKGILKQVVARAPGRHLGRVRTLISPSTSLNNKRKAISSQQGTGFFQELTKGLGNLGPVIAPLAALALA